MADEKHPVERLIEAAMEVEAFVGDEDGGIEACNALYDAAMDVKAWLTRERSVAREALEAVRKAMYDRVSTEENRVTAADAEIDRQIERLGCDEPIERIRGGRMKTTLDRLRLGVEGGVGIPMDSEDCRKLLDMYVAAYRAEQKRTGEKLDELSAALRALEES